VAIWATILIFVDVHAVVTLTPNRPIKLALFRRVDLQFAVSHLPPYPISNITVIIGVGINADAVVLVETGKTNEVLRGRMRCYQPT